MRNRDARRTRHAVATTGAWNRRELAIAFFDFVNDSLVGLGQHSYRRTPGIGHVVTNHLVGPHSTEDDGYFGHIPQEIQRPFDVRFFGVCVVENIENLGGHIVCQKAATQRFHDDNAKAFLTGVTQPLKTRLRVGVVIVHLNLAKIPEWNGVDDFFESGKVVVERESEMRNFARLLGTAHAVKQTKGQHFFLPEFSRQTMQKIKINMVRLQFLELVVQDSVEIISGIDDDHRRFCREIDFIAQIVAAQNIPCDNLTLAIVIQIRGVHIIQSLSNSVA